MTIEADLTVCGVYRGKIRVGEDSLVGQLARGLLGEALAHAGDMQRELQGILDGEDQAKKEDEPCGGRG